MYYFGIDIGSLYLKVALIDENLKILDEFYYPHRGNPVRELLKLFENYNSKNAVFAFTGDGSFILNGNSFFKVNLERTIIEYINYKMSGIKNIIDIGGSSIRYIEIGEDGNLKNYTENSLCAAGTGSFLDAQANRMGIDYKEVMEFKKIENPPKIASRCAVFAKSDLIHRQQEGYTKDALWSGLCRGLSQCIVQTLFRGRKINGRVAVVGGLSLNSEFLRWLEEILKLEVVIPPKAYLASSIGAAIIAKKSNFRKIDLNSLKDELKKLSENESNVQKPLQNNSNEAIELKISKYPSFDAREVYITNENTEVRINFILEDSYEINVFMGIDVGSTSTKAVIINENEDVIIDIYRKTDGDPIGATKKIFNAIIEISKNKGIKFNFKGVATTGSGRKMVGKIIGADLILNEITAHVVSALKSDPEIETIFEIGGQDSKFVRLQKQNVMDSNMNYICAAGTGSFVEEMANKLGYKVNDVGNEVLGIIPPKTSDRCTVFMEQDVMKILRKGYNPKEALGGVINSVVENYLHRVVGRRPISNGKIAFMGATARNKAIVAAFEKKLNREIVVSPYCHVMGAYGVAISVKKRMINIKKEKSSFIGLDFVNRSVEFKYEECNLCNNNCKITYAFIEGIEKPPSWGYMCGREPDDKKMKINEGFKPFRKRERILKEYISKRKFEDGALSIGIPLILQIHNYQVFFTEFLNNLGFNVLYSNKNKGEIKEKSISLAGAEFCFPAKLVYGHIESLINDPKVHYIFYPHMISETQNSYTTDAHFCPIIQGISQVSKASFRMNSIGVEKIINPVIDFRLSESQNAEKIYKELKKFFKIEKNHVLNAFKKALNAQKEYYEKLIAEGEKILKKIENENATGIVFIGRPYNLYDTEINIHLPEKISEYGYIAIPMDFLPFKPENLGSIFNNMFWNYGQRILSALRQVRERKNLFPVYLTNFNCGPDSFILSYAEEIMGDKPMLILELDEHGADAGYITRIEAFLQVIEELKEKKVNFTSGIGRKITEENDWEKRRLWIPPMHPIGSRLFASAFCSFGFNAKALPDEDKDAYEIGRRITRGSECLPVAATIGSFVKTMIEKGLNPEKEALFMPTAHGPCRFGQYRTTHLLALKKIGFSKVAILSPSSFNSYQGLPEKLRRFLWDIILTSDILFKMACKIRPYEIDNGSTDRVLKEEIKRCEEVIESKGSLEDFLKTSVKRFLSIPVNNGRKKPLVGIVGEIYVRCNPFSNENVVRAVESYGGEAWLTPISEWILYVSEMSKMSVKERTTFNQHGSLFKAVKSIIKDRFVKSIEHKYYNVVKDLLYDRMEPDIEIVIKKGSQYFPIEFKGEAIITVGRAILFAENGAQMVINCSPFSCMPGTLSSAALLEVQHKTGIPIVSMFYDGEEGQNRKLEVFLSNINVEKKL